jgi:hypothetical protein
MGCARGCACPAAPLPRVALVLPTTLSRSGPAYNLESLARFWSACARELPPAVLPCSERSPARLAPGTATCRLRPPHRLRPPARLAPGGCHVQSDWQRATSKYTGGRPRCGAPKTQALRCLLLLGPRAGNGGTDSTAAGAIRLPPGQPRPAAQLSRGGGGWSPLLTPPPRCCPPPPLPRPACHREGQEGGTILGGGAFLEGGT